MNEDSPPESTKGATLRTRLREATAAAIIAAAEQVFAEKGLHAAHMNDIAAHAGVAVGTLYNHFKDRDALLLALLSDRRAELLAIMDEFLEQPSSGDFRAELLELVNRMGGYLERNQRFHHILHQSELGQNLAAYPCTAASAPAMKHELYQRLEKMIQRGLSQGALRPKLASYYPSLLMGILRSMRIHMAETGVADHLPIDELVRFFMEGAQA